MASLNNPSAGLELTVAETEVLNEASPGVSAWTDLDLSAVVGANPALVELKLGHLGDYLAVRKNGDTEIGQFTSGAQIAYRNIAGFSYVVVPTDDDGIIEWYYNEINENVTIDVVFYIK